MSCDRNEGAPAISPDTGGSDERVSSTSSESVDDSSVDICADRRSGARLTSSSEREDMPKSTTVEFESPSDVRVSPGPSCREVAFVKDVLTLDEVEKMLDSLVKDPSAFKVAKFPPVNPKHNEGYIYRLKEDNDTDYKYDQISTWRNQGPGRIVPGSRVKKRYYILQVDKKIIQSCKRRIYSLKQTDGKKGSYVVIHYIAPDESLLISRPHGNRKHGDKPTVSVLKSVINRVKRLGFTSMKPTEIADTEMRKAAEELQADFDGREGILAPRNAKQVSNHRAIERSKLRLDPDEIYALNDMSRTSTGKFLIYHFKIAPSVQIIVAEPHMISLAKMLLAESSKAKQKGKDVKMLVSYDTTFSLNQCYVSPLIARNILLENDPIFAVGFLIHERKDTSAHSAFWEVMSRELELGKYGSEVPFITDKEESIRSSIRKYVPNVRLYVCHNHLLKHVEDWIRRNPIACSKESCIGYLKSIRKLLNSKTEEQFNFRYHHYERYWSAGFLAYVQECKLEDLRQSARYNYQREAAFEKCIPTNNISESENARIKFFIGSNQEMRLDTLVLALHHHQLRELYDFCRASGPTGRHCLKKEYATWGSRITRPSYCHLSKEHFTKILKGEVDALREAELTRKATVPAGTIQAATIAASNLVSLNSSSRRFVITDPVSRQINLVHFDAQTDQYKCNCGSSGLCMHVKAVLLALDMPFDPTSKPNIVQGLMSRIRKRFGKSGRKKPTFRDEDFILKPAEDSILGARTTLNSTFNSIPSDEDAEMATQSRSHQNLADPKTGAETETVVPSGLRLDQGEMRPATEGKTTDERARNIADLNYVHLDSASRTLQVTDDRTLVVHNVRFDRKTVQFICDCAVKTHKCVHVKAVYISQNMAFDANPIRAYQLGVLQKIRRGFGRQRRQRLADSGAPPKKRARKFSSDYDCSNLLVNEMIREEEEMARLEQEGGHISDHSGSEPAVSPGKPAYHSTPKRRKTKANSVHTSEHRTRPETPASPPRERTRNVCTGNDSEALKIGERNWLTSCAVENGIRHILGQQENNTPIGWSPQGLLELVGRGTWDKAVNLGAKHQLLDRDVILQPMNSVLVGKGEHWSLGVISLNDRTIYLLDSLRANRRCTDTMSRSFRTLFTVVSVILAGGGLRTYANDWTFLIADDMPKQDKDNDFDCGIHLLLAIEAIVQGRSLDSAKKENGRKWARELLSKSGKLGKVGNYNKKVNLSENVLKRYVASLAVQRLPQPAHADVGDMISEALRRSENNWTICDAGEECLRDVSHGQPQHMCVGCRRWLHPTCEILQRFIDSTYPSYLYCQTCFPGNRVTPTVLLSKGRQRTSASPMRSAAVPPPGVTPTVTPEAASTSPAPEAQLDDSASNSSASDSSSSDSSASDSSASDNSASQPQLDQENRPGPQSSSATPSVSSDESVESRTKPSQGLPEHLLRQVLAPCFNETNLSTAIGKMKGMAWTRDSCAYDSLLMILFHSTTVVDHRLFGQSSSGDKLVFDAAVKNAVNMLRRTGYVGTEAMETCILAIKMQMPETERNRETDIDAVIDGLFRLTGCLLEWADDCDCRCVDKDNVLYLPDTVPGELMATTQTLLDLRFTEEYYRLESMSNPSPPPALFVEFNWNNGRMFQYRDIIPNPTVTISGNMFRPSRTDVNLELIGMITLSNRHFVPYVKCGSTWLRMMSVPNQPPEVSECIGLHEWLQSFQFNSALEIPAHYHEITGYLYMCLYALIPP